MHELRGAPEPVLPELLEKLSNVDLVLIEGFKRESFPKLEVHRAANGKPLLQGEDGWIVAVASDTAAAAGDGAGDRSQRYRGHCRTSARAGVADRRHPGPRGRALMAQLTDDCFAFSGPLLPVDELEEIIAERVTPVAEIESVALARSARPRDCARRHRADRPAEFRQFRGRRLCRAAQRPECTMTRPVSSSSIASPPGDRPRSRCGRDRRSAFSPARRCRQGADTVFMQEDVRTEDGSVIVPAGLKRGANRQACGRGCARRIGRAAGRANSDDCRCRARFRARSHRIAGAAAHSRRIVLDRRRIDRARHAAERRIALRRQSPPADRSDREPRRQRHRSRHSFRRSARSFRQR